ncbi:cGMP-specific 3',5'-cyclic phosphodiesterase isoform X2 [Pygocentrus nattereri]|nr:cGMP-specific 3',5'-cyclic phosphodiesterase isoform X2 [Pygocentrus nattereri]
MPCLHTENQVRNPTDRESPSHPAPETTQRSKKKKKDERQSGWVLPPLWSFQTKTGQRGFQKALEGAVEIQESWPEDHSDAINNPRMSCGENFRFVKMSGWVRMHPKLSMLLLGRRRDSHPPCGSSCRLAPPAALEGPWLSLSLNQFEDCSGGHLVRSLLFPESSITHQYHQQQPGRSPCSAGPCGLGKCCDWMMGLLGGRSSHLKWQDVCHRVLVHICDTVAAERCCLAMTTTDEAGGQVLGPFFQTTKTQNHTHPDWERSIMGYVVSTGWPLNISDAYEDTRYHLKVDDSAACRPKSILSVPIKNQHDEVIGVVMAVNKMGTACFFSKQDEKVLSSHMALLGVILENKHLTERLERECHHNQVLLELLQLLTEHYHRCLETLLSKLSAVILQASKAKLCKIFISDQSDGECFSWMVCVERDDHGHSTHYCKREFDVNDVSYMYAVRVRTSTEMLNISNIKCVTQPTAAGFQTLICAPIRDTQRNLVLGVCELLNKVSTDSDEGTEFSRADERLLQTFVECCALALHNYAVQQEAKKNLTKLTITEEVLSYHISARVDEAEALEKCTVPSAHSLGLMEFTFSEAGLSLAASAQAAVRMFLDLDLLQTFNIEYKTLCRWVLSIRRGYRGNVAYHNWSHALSTAHCMFAIIRRTEQLQNKLSSLEILALMVSALSHDLDHRGVNNSYIHRAQQPLSRLYTHSTLEHHHINICLLILNNPDSRILCNLSSEDYKACIGMIEKNILATDLTVHTQRRSEFFDLVDDKTLRWEHEEHRDLLRSVLMTACDVCAITKPWKEQKRIARLVAEEFFAQGDREKREFNIRPDAVMDRVNSTRLAELQVQYIDSICSPLYGALSSLFESCSPLKDGCTKNREKWQMLVEKGEEKRDAVKE